MKHLLIILLAASAAALAGCGGDSSPQAGTDELVIYSAHSEEIISEFTAGFRAWYKARTGRDVAVSWPDPGGGGTQMLKRLEDKFRAHRFDVDICFGGGPLYNRMDQLGMLAPCPLPEAVRQALPLKAAGQPLVDPDGHWYGSAISTFGIIYNKTLLRDKGLPEIKDWESLADPKLAGFVGLGDPGKSSTALKTIEIILQAYGYERGMSIAVRTGANAREFYAAAYDVPRNTAKGFIAAGPCIDFYAYRQMHSEGGERLGLAVPPGLTVITPDPIGVLKNAPHPAVAAAFVEFVVSPAGQRLWMLPVGAPGGPTKHALQRLSLLPAVVDEAAALGVAVPFNPFTAPPADFYSPEKETSRQAVLADYLRVAMVENHAGLKRAWQAIIAAGLPPERVALLVRPLVTEDEMIRLGRDVWAPVLVPDDAPADEKAKLTREQEVRQRRKSDLLTAWSEAFRTRYEALAK